MTLKTTLIKHKPEGDLDLVQARHGDSAAFSRLMEPHRHELIAYCYRLTGSLSEAEDLTQEAFVRAFRALTHFEGRASTRAWLYRIAHNLCLNHVKRSHAWDSWEDLPEKAVMEAPQMEREDMRLGFAALMQSLPPRQRATLVLRDVLGWSAEETARILETTVPAVKNALGRARQTLARQPLGDDLAQITDLTQGDPEAQSLLAQWVDAFEKGNTPRIVALLTEDKTGYNHEERSGEYVKKTPKPGRLQSDGRE